MSKKKIQGIVGLAFGNAHLSYAHVVIENGAPVLKSSGTVPFGVNPITDTPDLTGAELRRILRTAKVKEKACVICIPASRVLTAPVEIPDGLEGDDLRNFLALEAEREFCFGNGEAALSTSRSANERDTLAAASAEQLGRLTTAANGAKMKVLGIVPGATALKRDDDGVIFINELGIELVTGRGDHVDVIRQLTPNLDATQMSALKESTIDVVIRDLKIALASGVLTPDSTVAIFGHSTVVRDLCDVLEEEIPSVKWVCGKSPDELSAKSHAAALQLSAFHAAETLLEARPIPLTFDSPVQSHNRRFGQVDQLTAYRKYAVAAIAVTVILLSAYTYRWARLLYLRQVCSGLKPAAESVEVMRKEVKRMTVWHGTTPITLDLMKKITTAFPEYGTVWLTGLSVDEDLNIQMSGQAKSRNAWLEMHANLLKTRSIRNLRIQQTRTKSKKNDDLSFSLAFTYVPGGR